MLQGKQWGHTPIQIPPIAFKQFPIRACTVCTAHRIWSETSGSVKNVKFHYVSKMSIHTSVNYYEGPVHLVNSVIMMKNVFSGYKNNIPLPQK